jgi:predicted Zn-dependent protease
MLRELLPAIGNGHQQQRGGRTVKRIAMQIVCVIGAVVLVSAGLQLARADEGTTQAAVVGGELATIANQLRLRPETALDFTKVSGEYCFDVNLGAGGHMHHHAVDPTRTQEDVIDFVNAEPLIRAGVNLDAMPRFPGKLGTMTPNQWYLLPAGELEPHHGITFPFPLLIKAVNLK